MGMYYKVVNVTDDGIMQSVNAGGSLFPTVIYSIGERAWPAIGGLLAFRTVERAREFLEQVAAIDPCRSWKILRGCGKLRRLCKFMASLNYEIWYAWDGQLKDGLSWPEGTVALDYFEPEEVVT